MQQVASHGHRKLHTPPPTSMGQCGPLRPVISCDKVSWLCALRIPTLVPPCSQKRTGASCVLWMASHGHRKLHTPPPTSCAAYNGSRMPRRIHCGDTLCPQEWRQDGMKVKPVASALTAILLVNTFRFTLPPSLWSLGNIFPSSKHTWGTQKKYSPPPEYMCFTRPCARTCAPATTVAVGRLGRRPRQAWTKVFSESPSQTSLEMYHRRRHRVTPGRGASLGARARSEAIWVLLRLGARDLG